MNGALALEDVEGVRSWLFRDDNHTLGFKNFNIALAMDPLNQTVQLGFALCVGHGAVEAVGSTGGGGHGSHLNVMQFICSPILILSLLQQALNFYFVVV